MYWKAFQNGAEIMLMHIIEKFPEVKKMDTVELKKMIDDVFVEGKKKRDEDRKAKELEKAQALVLAQVPKDEKEPETESV